MAMAVAAAEWWEAAAEAIVAYTGMTPAAVFTAVAVAAALYVAVSGLLARPAQARRREAAEEEEEERTLEPLPPPVQLGEVTEEELRAYDGSDPKKPLLMAIKGQIYDVTQSRMFYGPGGPYALFTGRDASRALAKMSFETSDLTGDISGLSPFEAEALQEWEYKFKSKYVTVGTIKKAVRVAEEDIARSTVTTERDIDASTLENNNVPEPKETEASNQGSIIEKTTGTPDIDVNTSSHEDTEEKGKELSDSDATNASSLVDAVEKPDETSNSVVKNSSTEEAFEPKEIPDAAVKNSSTDEAFEPKEIPDAAVKNSSSTEEAVKPKETPQVVDDKNRCKSEDATERPNEAADAVGLKNTTRHEDATEEAVEPKEIPDAAVKNSSSTEEAVEPKETPQVVDDKNRCKSEDATERPNEAADAVGLKNTTRHEDAGQPKETWNIDEKDLSSRQDGEEKPKET